ncbi:hypothetical protein RHSIM_Rhsim11G0051600 [Rhododendron simsii]|uniref:SLC26A/SulP transporter domain-containing protein n=1 Tax=Rhododendron simsii TaxID=118357 RepID=A0A834G6U2_RHOSS|nr:hypothetical protein RHSIM_Rhsim11G0051600 [Rhododendron simsii]
MLRDNPHCITMGRICRILTRWDLGVPPRQKILKEFTSTLKETFFHNEPLRRFKDQPKSQKLVLGLQALFPILAWGRDYNISKFKGDLMAGLTIASLAIPQDIGYAKLANLDPAFGLYTSFVPPLFYAFMGSSRDIAIGPVAVVSLQLGTLLQNEIDPANKVEYQRLVFTATFFAGIAQATLGVLRLGFLNDFLSHASIVGFMAGAAITIGLQQLKGFLGLNTFTKKTDLVSWNWANNIHRSFILGLSSDYQIHCRLVPNFFTQLGQGKRNRKWFWVPAIAPLISVIISTLLVFNTHADKHGVQTVNHIKKGVNPASANQIFFTGGYLLKGFRIGVVAGMVALTESIAIGRSFAAIKDYELDGNKEIILLAGSLSFMAVNFTARCNTTVSNIVMSCVLLLTLLVITPLFKYTPNAVIASIIISAVMGMIDIEAAILIWKIDKLDFTACMGAFFVVVFVSVEIGLLIAVGLSFAKIQLQVTRPRTALLGKLPRTSVYRNMHQYPDATNVPGFLILVLANPGRAVIDVLYASGFANLIGDGKIFLTVADAVLTYAPQTEEP